MSTTNRRWIEEYHRMIEAGILTNKDRVELLEGQIIEISPQRPLHTAMTGRCDRFLQRLVNSKATVRVQSPITFSNLFLA